MLDSYFTAYFNAWLDNQNLSSGPKRVVTGFAPRLAMDPVNLDRFFAAYPDGKLVSLVRDPRGWYLSASSYAPEHYADVEVALTLWRRSTEASLEALDRFGERAVVVTYERLVRSPEETVSSLAQRLGLTMAPELLVPTFNGRPIRANSSDPVASYGVLAERVDAYRDALDRDTIGRIERLADGLYERAEALAP